MIRILILLLTFGIITPRAKAELSLALVPENEAARPAADLLLAELSSEPGLRLLERAELQRIVSEQSLSLANSQDLLRIGKLAGADSLLLLDHFSRVRESGQSQQFIGLRLILVQAGVVLHTADYAWPVPDPSEWSVSVLGTTCDPRVGCGSNFVEDLEGLGGTRGFPGSWS